MAVPKKKTSHSKSRKRRSHEALSLVTNFWTNPETEQPLLPHQGYISAAGKVEKRKKRSR